MLKCPNCGASINSNECEYCGYVVAQPLGTQANNPRLPGDSAARASFICGLIGLISSVLCCFPVGLPLGIVSIIMGHKAKKLGDLSNKSKTGFLLGFIALGISALILFLYVLGSFTGSLDNYSNNNNNEVSNSILDSILDSGQTVNDQSAKIPANKDMDTLLKDPVPFTKSGRGDDILNDFVTESSYTLVHFTHSGSRNFSVISYDSSSKFDLLVNHIGNYDGYVLLSGKDTFKLEIKADGEWLAEVVPFKKADGLSFSGSGDAVTDVFLADKTDWHFSHNGTRNFIVYQYSLSGKDLLVNKIGIYDGSVVSKIKNGTASFFVIKADGDWTVSPK